MMSPHILFQTRDLQTTKRLGTDQHGQQALVPALLCIFTGALAVASSSSKLQQCHTSITVQPSQSTSTSQIPLLADVDLNSPESEQEDPEQEDIRCAESSSSNLQQWRTLIAAITFPKGASVCDDAQLHDGPVEFDVLKPLWVSNTNETHAQVVEQMTKQGL